MRDKFRLISDVSDLNKHIIDVAYEALPATASMEEGMARYDKVRDAAGGDDFAEFIPAKSLTALETEGSLQIELTEEKMTISVVRPPLKPIASKKGRRR